MKVSEDKINPFQLQILIWLCCKNKTRKKPQPWRWIANDAECQADCPHILYLLSAAVCIRPEVQQLG